MQRTDLLDTKPWAHKEVIRRLRQMTPEQRIQMALKLTDLGGRMHRAALRQLEEDRSAPDGPLGK